MNGGLVRHNTSESIHAA